MEIIQMLVALVALGFSIWSLFISKGQNAKILQLESKKMFLEFGTLETIALEKDNLRKSHQENIHSIHTKWTDEQNREASKLAYRGMANSSDADNMKKRVEEGRRIEQEAEDRIFRLEMKKLDEKEKLIRDKK